MAGMTLAHAHALPRTGPVVACAVLGSIGTREEGSRWYETLPEPALQPPAVALWGRDQERRR